MPPDVGTLQVEAASGDLLVWSGEMWIAVRPESTEWVPGPVRGLRIGAGPHVGARYDVFDQAWVCPRCGAASADRGLLEEVECDGAA